ncbi:energy transducer TonB [Pontibacter sp. KCTC 32443]|uniref:energy transducer TonB n=1 Tax=Pontibacter TaxID=323449 RepID=UPI00164EBDC8|nr:MULTISPECIES: energy transducer TonB [Pontibacter]MBC5775946.1 energy transducer TonB [Pontibacter sp. KCTC 32443]
MKESYLFDMTFNNIIFKGRNQAYGAYKLRRVYHRHIIIAAILAIAIFSGGLIGPLVNNIFFTPPERYVKPVIDIIEPITIVLPPLPVDPEPVKETAPTAAPEKVKVKTEVYVANKIVPDDAPVKETIIANQEDLQNANIGVEKVDGVKPSDLPVTMPSDDLIGIDGGTGTEENTDNSIKDFAEIMPEYEGGFDALAKYMGRKMIYPGAARSAGIEGTVVVSFVVSRNGAIEDVKVLKGLGFGTDEEAMRVVRSMPRWKPGKQNGTPVAVRYTLPIKFALKN